MHVFMTGANGFVGLNIVAALKEAGHRVTAFVRTASKVTYLEPFGVSIVRGELGNAAEVQQAMQGADAVIHTAGSTSCYMRDLPMLNEVNVRGTQNVVAAAIAHRVKRLVYTSTTSTIGASNGKRPASEETPLTGFRARSPYGITKRLAEQAVLRAQAHGVECVILNPAEVVGPYDHTMQWGRMVLAVSFNQVPFVPPGGGSFCSAADVGRAHVSALTRGLSGERYILGGENASFSRFLDVTAQVVGRNFDVPRTRYSWLYLQALMQEKLAPLMPGKPVVEPYRMRVFGGNYYFDSSKAEQALAYRSAPLEHMVRDCSDWYRRHGFMH
jgi:dihydroflavonol-4-reductase